jgi:hypothetical protein
MRPSGSTTCQVWKEKFAGTSIWPSVSTVIRRYESAPVAMVSVRDA